MNSADFVEGIRSNVANAALEDTKSLLRKPPGRKVSAAEKELSDWYNSLSEGDLIRVNKIISMAVHAAVFGFFSVIDGVRTIDDRNGRFDITYVADGNRILLNDPSDIGLHNLFNSRK